MVARINGFVVTNAVMLTVLVGIGCLMTTALRLSGSARVVPRSSVRFGGTVIGRSGVALVAVSSS